MTATAIITDRKIFTGTAAHGGGTFTADVAITADRSLNLRAHAFLTAASGGHLIAVGAYETENLVYSNNGAIATPTAISGSNNPQSSTNLRPSRVIAQDSAFQSGGGAASTASWSVSGTNARLTVTNNGTSQDADVTVVVEIYKTGSV